MALTLLWSLPTRGQTSPSLDPDSEIFFDAASTSFNRTGLQIFEGDVIAIAPGTVITADRIAFDREQQTLTAVGHVLALNAKQVLTGETLEFHQDTGEFTLTQASMEMNSDSSAEVVHKILGFTPKEFAFEEGRSKQLENLIAQKNELIAAYRDSAGQEGGLSQAEFTERLAVILEKIDLTKMQENPALAQSTEERRQTLKRRREYWEKRRQDAAIQKKLAVIGYFAVSGDTIVRLNASEFKATRAFITPCLCEVDETPAWGFRADQIVAQTEGYANLRNAVLMVKGIPIFYLPHLTIPMKGRRQSGFLPPSISYSNKNGNVFSQPVFFAFSPHSDATLTADLIEKRGLHLGVEYRTQPKKYSGWEMSLEGMRDELWLTQMQQRSEVVNFFVPWCATKTAGNKTEQQVQNCQEYYIRNRLSSPQNSWRGKYTWRGFSILAPRVSLVSSGMLLTDHRYLEDLFVPNFANLLSNDAPPLLARNRVRAHLDGTWYYVGADSSLGDNTQMATPFGGYQLPFSVKAQTRLFVLTPKHSPVPVYGQASLLHRSIDAFHPADFESPLGVNQRQQELGAGTWDRYQIKTVSPLVVHSIFRTNHFAEFELRKITLAKPDVIEHEVVAPGASAQDTLNYTRSTTMTSVITGLKFDLPVKGSLALSPVRDELTGKKQFPFLEHQMNWGLIFSVRPFVDKNGSYGNAYQKLQYDTGTKSWAPTRLSQKLTYFDSDNDLYDNDTTVPQEMRMYAHRKVTFTTTHDWFIRKKISLGPKKKGAREADKEETKEEVAAEPEGPKTYSDQARDELSASLSAPEDKPVNLTNVSEERPAHFEGNIGYDFMAANRKVAVPWSNNLEAVPWTVLTTNAAYFWQKWTFQLDSQYDIYVKAATDQTFRIVTAPYFDSTASYSYRVQKAYGKIADGLQMTLQQTQEWGLTSKLIHHVISDFRYGYRLSPGQTPDRQFMTLASLKYLSPSNCWGISAAWKRDYTDSTWDGTYFLALSINFFNHTREFGNLATRWNKSPES